MIETRLLPDGVQFGWEKGSGPESFSWLVDRLIRIKDTVVMGRTASVEEHDTTLIIRNAVVSTMHAFGIPVQVSRAQAQEWERHNNTMFRKSAFGCIVDVYDAPDGLYVLSPWKDCTRRLFAVKHRYGIAKNIGCSYYVEGGQASWRGQITIRI